MSDQAQGQSEQPSIRDRIGSVLASQEQPAEPEQVVEVEAPEVEPQITETPEEAVEANPTEDWREVELDGEKLQVPPKWEKAFLQERDYTQKTQTLADQRRLVELREQGLQAQVQTLTQLHPLYTQSQLLEQAINQYHQMDWRSLQAQDPVDYASKRADYAALMQQKNDLQHQIQQGSQYLQQQQREQMRQAAKAAEPIIRKAIPDWGPEKDQKLTKFALDNGATAEELTGLAARPWAVVLLEKARMFDELQASKAQLPRKVQNLSPVAKPGAKPTVQNAQVASYRKNQEAFRKSGGKDKDALRALIKARLG